MANHDLPFDSPEPLPPLSLPSSALPPGALPRDRGEEVDIGGADQSHGAQPWGPRDKSLNDKSPGDLSRGGKPSDHIDHRVGDIGGQATPGMSNEQLIDLIIQSPQEQLIPWEDCRLPSRGLWYGWNNDGFCRVRAMGQAAEKVLANQRLVQSGQAIDGLLNECCQFPSMPDGTPFDPLDLIAGDRIFLLYYLRGITHGNIYEFAVTCANPDCGTSSTHSYDINELASTVVWGRDELGQEPFKVVMPYMSEATGREVWVGVRWLRGRDAANMVASRRQRKKLFAQAPIRAGRSREDDNPFTKRRRAQAQSSNMDDTLTENLDQLIVSVMGVQDRQRIQAIIPKLHATDTAAIRSWLQDNTPGIETMVTLNCPDCDRQFTIQLPITESFFRPTQPGRDRR